MILFGENSQFISMTNSKLFLLHLHYSVGMALCALFAGEQRLMMQVKTTGCNKVNQDSGPDLHVCVLEHVQT